MKVKDVISKLKNVLYVQIIFENQYCNYMSPTHISKLGNEFDDYELADENSIYPYRYGNYICLSIIVKEK